MSDSLDSVIKSVRSKLLCFPPLNDMMVAFKALVAARDRFVGVGSFCSSNPVELEIITNFVIAICDRLQGIKGRLFREQKLFGRIGDVMKTYGVEPKPLLHLILSTIDPLPARATKVRIVLRDLATLLLNQCDVEVPYIDFLIKLTRRHQHTMRLHKLIDRRVFHSFQEDSLPLWVDDNDVWSHLYRNLEEKKKPQYDLIKIIADDHVSCFIHADTFRAHGNLARARATVSFIASRTYLVNDTTSHWNKLARCKDIWLIIAKIVFQTNSSSSFWFFANIRNVIQKQKRRDTDMARVESEPIQKKIKL